MSRSVRAGRMAGLALVSAALVAAPAFGHTKSFFKKKYYKKQPKPSLTIQYTNQDPSPAPPPPPGGGPPPPTPTPVDPIDFFSGQLSFLTRNPGPCGTASRTVQVNRDGVGLFGEVKTGAGGSWQLSAEDVPAGSYRAFLPKEKITVTIPPVPGVTGGHIHKYLCRSASAGPITAGP